MVKLNRTAEAVCPSNLPKKSLQANVAGPTQVLHTPLASFSYQHLKPTPYFGYQVLRPTSDGSQFDRPVLMATLEKALLDYCYLNPHLATIDDFAAMRLNATLLRERVDPARLNTYLTLFNHQKLSGRIGVLRHYINDYA